MHSTIKAAETVENELSRTQKKDVTKKDNKTYKTRIRKVLNKTWESKVMVMDSLLEVQTDSLLVKKTRCCGDREDL
jgi:hypothetical protein